MVSDFIDKLYQRMLPYWGVEKKVIIYPIDFDLPWWKILFRFKIGIFFVIFLELIFSSLRTLFPILVSWAIFTGDFNNYLLILSIIILSIIQNYFKEYILSFATSSILASVNNSTNRFFLTVDPHFHSTRSSGQIISKVTRGVSSYEVIIDFVVYSFLPIIAGITSVTGALFYQSWQLGVIGGVFLILIVTIGIVVNSIVINKISKYRIEEEDKLKSFTVENLQEVLLIRSVFATDAQIDRVENQSKQVIKHQINSWMINTIFFQIPRIIYIISLIVVGYLIFQLLAGNSINAVTAVAILATFSEGASRLLYMGGQVSRFIQQIKNIQDMFDFIRNFGKQTFPVMSTDKIIKYDE